MKRSKLKRNAFDLSHSRKFSAKFGTIYPIMCTEVIPGDTFKVDSVNLVRFAPLIAPLMHTVNVFTHFFYIPNRILWDEWTKFITGGERGEFVGANSPVFPQFYDSKTNLSPNNDHVKVGSLMDFLTSFSYYGNSPSDTRLKYLPAISQLPFRAYQLIWNEWYRSQDLQDEISVPFTSGQEPYNGDVAQRIMQLRQCNWDKDYFTSALPYAQKGAPVSIPMSGDVSLKDVDDRYAAPGYIKNTSGGTLNSTAGGTVSAVGTNPLPSDSALLRTTGLTWSDANQNAVYDPNGTLEVTGGSTLINDLRNAISLQRFFERNARAGSRYVEFIREHFRRRVPDSTIQRPEYLGGGMNQVNIGEVLQTSETRGDAPAGADVTPQGTMAGHAVGLGKSNSFKYHFVEHGLIMGVMFVRPKLEYHDAIPRYLFKKNQFDFYFPEFAHIGEQEIQNKELFPELLGAATTGDLEANKSYQEAVFGYQSRNAEYKFIPSSIHGDMRKTLDFWHMNKRFLEPKLNSDFLTIAPDDPNLLRPFAVQDGTDVLWCQVFNRVRAIRPIPFFSEPGLTRI